MTDILVGIAIGSTCTFGLSIAFVLYCMWFAKRQHHDDELDEHEQIREDWL